MIIENVQSENWFPLRFAVSVRYLVEELCTAMCNPIFATQSQRLEYNIVPFRGRRQGSRMFSSQWTFRLGWPLGRVLLELKAVMAVNERN